MPATEGRLQLKLDQMVLATEFSPASEAATQYARVLAKRFGAKLTLVNIIDLSTATRSEDAVVGLPIEELHRTSNKEVEALASEMREGGIKATGHVLESHNPAAAITGLAGDLGADLLVIGTHSRHGLNKFILGSCAEGLIHHARCPVMTIGPRVVPAADAFNGFDTVLFATELHQGAAERAKRAFEFVEREGKMWLLHLIEKPDRSITDTLRLQLAFESELDILVPYSSYEWCEAEGVVDYGAPAQKILAFAQQVDADLIVLGARHSSSWLAHLCDGTVGKVIAESLCPVVTLGFAH